MFWFIVLLPSFVAANKLVCSRRYSPREHLRRCSSVCKQQTNLLIKFRCIFSDLSGLAALPPRPISLSPLALSLSASSTETNNPAVNLLSEHNHLITIFLNRWRSSRGISEQFLNGGPRRGGRATIPIPLWRSSCVHMTQNY